MPRSNPASLRRELVLAYSTVLVVALAVFAGTSYAFLAHALSAAGTSSLRQTALAAEQLIVPDGVPRLATREESIRAADGSIGALRRRTRLATGEVVDIYIGRSDAAERRALASYALVATLLIPITALAASLAGVSIANRLLGPLQTLIGALRRVDITALGQRVPEPSRPAEMRELARSFNGMQERLDRAVTALRRFTGDASHELRTPLTVIRGTADVALSRPRTQEELRSALAEVGNESRSMLHLVEDLLALARGEEGFGGPATEVDLGDVLREVREITEVLVADKPITVTVYAPVGLLMRGNSAALRRLFLNVAENAAKFTTAGDISISAAVHSDEETGDAEVAVRIADTGCGIEPTDLPLVFDRFYRADAARSASGGTGLGLAIARMIAERHGGTIHIESRPGAGSTAIIRLPA